MTPRFRHGDESSGGAPAPGTEENRLPRLPGGDERILVVEDRADVRSATRRMLERLGYRVDDAEDGREARERAAQGPPYDLLLTDVVLPGDNGLRVAEAILEEGGAGSVLFMSGFTSEVVLPAPDALGVPSDFLRKPFTLAELAQRVRALMDKERPGR